jgi:hypothetical protein
MRDLFAAVGEFLQGVIGVFNALIMPTDPATGVLDWTLLTGDPIKLMIWFAMIFGFVPITYRFIINAIAEARGEYDDDDGESYDTSYLDEAYPNRNDDPFWQDVAARPWKYSTKYFDHNGLPQRYQEWEDDSDWRRWIDHGDRESFDRWAANREESKKRGMFGLGG